VNPDGILAWQPDGKDQFRKLLSYGGHDIDDIQTDAQFERAWSAAGDYFFTKIHREALEGDPTARLFLKHYWYGKESYVLAVIARASFEVIDGGRTGKVSATDVDAPLKKT
jgi:hypothetical protein